MKISQLSHDRLVRLANVAKADDGMLTCLLVLSAKEGDKEIRRVNAALGITAKERRDLMKAPMYA
ncbi:hypothetical protein NL154_05650 [Rhizobium sp. YTUHZ044]|uniref:hypothetical protein n=1 Tax=Rhizobium sp. YTUHZ044 TaxID=2962678 RepID=UPI003DA80463